MFPRITLFVVGSGAVYRPDGLRPDLPTGPTPGRRKWKSSRPPMAPSRPVSDASPAPAAASCRRPGHPLPRPERNLLAELTENRFDSWTIGHSPDLADLAPSENPTGRRHPDGRYGLTHRGRFDHRPAHVTGGRPIPVPTDPGLHRPTGEAGGRCRQAEADRGSRVPVPPAAVQRLPQGHQRCRVGPGGAVRPRAGRPGVAHRHREGRSLPPRVQDDGPAQRPPPDREEPLPGRRGRVRADARRAGEGGRRRDRPARRHGDPAGIPVPADGRRSDDPATAANRRCPRAEPARSSSTPGRIHPRTACRSWSSPGRPAAGKSNTTCSTSIRTPAGLTDADFDPARLGK